MSFFRIDGRLIKFVSELYGLPPFIFIRNLEKQCIDINLNIYEEVKKRKPKKILVVGPAISPYFFQLADRIENSLFVALDKNKNILDLTRSVVNRGESFKAIDTSKIPDEIKPEIKSFVKTYVGKAKDMMTNAPLWPVKNPKNLYEKIEFVHGDFCHLPYHDLDFILAFNVIQYLEPSQIYNAFYSMKYSLRREGFFIVSGNIEMLHSVLSLSKKIDITFFLKIAEHYHLKR